MATVVDESIWRVAWGLYFLHETEAEIDKLFRTKERTTDDRLDMVSTFYDYFLNEGASLLVSYNLAQEDIKFVKIDYTRFINTCPVESVDKLLENRPTSVIPCLGIAVFLLRSTFFDADRVPHTRVNVQLVGSIPSILFGDLKSNLLGKFIAIKGTVVRTSQIKPLVLKCDFICAQCGASTSRTFEDGKYNAPKSCSNKPCRGRSFEVDRSSAETVDFQKIKLQEVDDRDMEPGRIPRTLEVDMTEDLVEKCVPGDQVLISGIVRSVNSEVHAGRSGKRALASSIFILFLQANSIQCVATKLNDSSTKSLKGAADDSDFFSQDELREINNVASTDRVFDRLVHSLCPGIFGNNLVKAGLLLCLFGGSKPSSRTSSSDSSSETNVSKDYSSIHYRSDPHILIVGDPGLGKSQMLRSVLLVAPRAVYVCGNTTTTTGMTVTISKDSNGDTGLEAGALVLADQGVCCIDEFDKMNIDYQALLETMEQQSVSIAKAGILCNLNARTTVIAAANPVGGHYNRSKSVCENLKMKAALLSRFDLIFVLLDRPDAARDNLLAEHIMSMHAYKGPTAAAKRKKTNKSVFKKNANNSEEAPALNQRLQQNAYELSQDLIPLPTLRKYLLYARLNIQPRLSAEAAALLQSKYLEMRSTAAGPSTNDTVPITTRQLESLIRLAQARAKMELRTIVTKADAAEVVEILQESLIDTLTNEAGELDFGRRGGMSLAKQVKAFVARLGRTSLRRNDAVYSFQQLLDIANSMAIKADNFYDFIEILRNECYLTKKGPKLYQFQLSSFSQVG